MPSYATQYARPRRTVADRLANSYNNTTSALSTIYSGNVPTGSGNPAPDPSKVQRTVPQYAQVAGDVMQANETAKAANEDRYRQILEKYGQRYGEAQNRYNQMGQALMGGYANRYKAGMGLLENSGVQHKADIADAYAKQAASSRQGLINQGLASSTIMPTVQRGVEDAKQAELRRAEEGLRQQRVSAHSQLAGDQLNALERAGTGQIHGLAGLYKEGLDFMERRNDPYTDPSALYSLSQQYGQAGGEGNRTTTTSTRVSGYGNSNGGFNASNRTISDDFPALRFDKKLTENLTGSLLQRGFTQAQLNDPAWRDQHRSIIQAELQRLQSQPAKTQDFGIL